jgi:SAM-dependent methyltransferase
MDQRFERRIGGNKGQEGYHFDPDKHLKKFYTQLYASQEKHDSPDESRNSIIRRIKEFILRGQVSPPRVLNIGSGPQAIEKQMLTRTQGALLKQKNIEFVTIDLADIASSDLLSRDIEKVKHVRANAVNLPFADQSFGLVVSNHAIDFCPQEEAFKEVHRVLNTRGKGIFYLHHPSMLKEMSRNPEVKVFWQYLKNNSILFSTEEDIIKFLEKVGFTATEISLNSDEMRTDTWWEVVAEKK